MKNTAAFFLALALPAALCAQQAKQPAEAEQKAAAPAKPGQAAEIKVIQPGKATTAAEKAAAAKTAAPAAPAAKADAKPAAAKTLVQSPLSKALKAEAKAAAAPAAKPAAAPEKKAAPVRPSGPVPGFVIRPGAPRVQPKDNAAGGFAVGKKHTVEKGDTLWDLSGKYYKNPFMWGRIYNANMKTVADPDRISPLEELYIPDLEEVVLPYRRPEPAAQAAAPEAAEERDGADDEFFGGAAPKAQKAQVKLSGVAMPGEILRDFDRDFISEEMPEDQREWGSGVRVVPDSWSEDGVVTAKTKAADDFADDGLSVTGEILEISMDKEGLARPGDYLAVFLKGGDAYDRDGNYKGREIQPAGLAEVISAEGTAVKARVIDATTAIFKGYIVKKK